MDYNARMLVRFDLRLTGKIAKKPDCPVKNRAAGNPSYRPMPHISESSRRADVKLYN